MVEARPLTEDEIYAVENAFKGAYAERDRLMFMLGVLTGTRVSALIAFTVGDVWQNGQPVTHVQIIKDSETRTIPVNADLREVIEALIAWHRSHFGSVHPDTPLFPSQKHGGGVAPLQRQAVHKLFKAAFKAAGLAGNVTTESLRKTFAHRIYNQTGRIDVVRQLTGQKNVKLTARYLHGEDAPNVSMEVAEETMKALEFKEKRKERED